MNHESQTIQPKGRAGKNSVQGRRWEEEFRKGSRYSKEEAEILNERAGIIFSDEDSDLRKIKWHVHRYAGVSRSGKNIMAHMIVLQRMTGIKPNLVQVTDHINRNSLDNRRCNLRMTDRLGNAQNKPNDGFRGTTWHKRAGKWQPLVQYNHKAIYLGLFFNRVEAAQVAAAKRKELGFLGETP